MKNHLFSTFILLMTFSVLISCRSDSDANPRAFVTGRIVSAPVNYHTYMLSIYSDGISVAETGIQPDGNFELSGPINSEEFSLISSEKIKSFRADKNGLRLSADSLQIIVPSGITYLKFDEIQLTK